MKRVQNTSAILQTFSFACFKLLNSFFSKSDSKKLQHEVLPDNCQLKTFEICCQTAAKNVSSFSISMKPTTIQMTCFNFFCCDQ